MLEDRPERREIDRLDIGDKKGRVRVPDIGADRCSERAEREFDAVGLHRPGERDLAPARSRRSHIDRDASLRQNLGVEQSGNGLDSHPGIAGLAMQQGGHATRGVAAGFGLAAVGVADAHPHPGRRMTRRLEQDHLVAANTGSPVRQRACARRIDRNRRAAAVEHNEVVAQAVHFEERDLAHWRRLYGGAYGPVQRSAAPAKLPAAENRYRLSSGIARRKPFRRTMLERASVEAALAWRTDPPSDRAA